METVVYRFVGQPGEYHYAIPARDLTADDVAGLTDDQKATVEASKLYERPAVAGGRRRAAAPEAESGAPE